ncbi:TAXI family TRAP transporter solute-binding subunit [Pelobacter seleniigenes]|uniref:TAXI family TRAP transporter solute-binding subunit n=1 Tax=Pelobacter seleniigenes TaxID=407188 RepID=UPI0004A6EBE6|nr:TAXI family TRAP transporter solute-binding subunit [Pelobacter seleniigenes]
MTLTRLISSAGLLAMFLCASVVHAETRVTYKSAKTSSSYYQMAVQIAEAIKAGTGGEVIVTVEESQGSVQNVKEVMVRSGNYVFTTPPALIKQAQTGQGKFAGDDPAKYNNVRSLFPIPSLTMHFVVRADSGIKDFADLAGKSILIGKGSFGAREAEKYFQLFGLEGKVKLANVELGSAVQALKNRQIDGFATSGSFPAPNVVEAAAGIGVQLLSLSDEQVVLTKRTKLLIPAGTYPGVDYPVTTTSLPVIAYATTDMADEIAYQLTKAFWEQKQKMAKSNAWWGGVSPEMLSNIYGKLHPGALRYYQEQGITVPEAIR